MENGYLESDWKLFRSKIANWQEAYMEKLCIKYTKLLSNPKKQPSTKFWELDKKIRRDQKSVGVICDMRRSRLVDNILMLLKDQVITREDLNEFSDVLQDKVDSILQMNQRLNRK